MKFNLNPNEILHSQENREEFVAWAMSDHDFLYSFSRFLLTGWSEEMSRPWAAEQLRALILPMLPELAEWNVDVQRIVKLEEALSAERGKYYNLRQFLLDLEDPEGLGEFLPAHLRQKVRKKLQE